MIVQNTGGNIILTASISAYHFNFPQAQVAYNTSKATILQRTHSLTAEWARYGIHVKSTSPGYIDMILNHGEGLEECKNILTSRNPMARIGNTEELRSSLAAE